MRLNRIIKSLKDVSFTIKELESIVDWWDISVNYCLSEKFIRKYVERVDWSAVSEHQKLSYNFIDEFAHKVNWHEILYYQTDVITPELLIKHFNIIKTYKNITGHPMVKDTFIIDDYNNIIDIKKKGSSIK